MALPAIHVHHLDTVYSPFSGQPADTDEGPNTADPSLLFVYYGDASVWGHISRRVIEQAPNGEGDPEDFDPHELAAKLEFDGAMIMVVDTDWNGVNYYGFAPAATDE